MTDPSEAVRGNDLRGLAERDQYHAEKVQSPQEKERWAQLDREMKEAHEWGKEFRARARKMVVYP